MQALSGSEDDADPACEHQQLPVPGPAHKRQRVSARDTPAGALCHKKQAIHQHASRMLGLAAHSWPCLELYCFKTVPHDVVSCQRVELS